MLHLLYGPAASGKTDLLMGRIRTAVAARTPGQVLLVPEQYSHEAERALCAACGDSLSLYAEVLSFTGLARRVAVFSGECHSYGEALCLIGEYVTITDINDHSHSKCRNSRTDHER